MFVGEDPSAFMNNFAMFFHQVACDGIQLVDVRADVEEVSAVNLARVLVGVVGVVPEGSLQEDREMFVMFPVCLCLYMRVDEGHVDFS